MHGRMHRLALAALAAALWLGGPAPAHADGFAEGDLLVQTWTGFGGDLRWHRADGTLVAALAPDGVLGVADDPSGRVWATRRDNRVTAFGRAGEPLGAIADPFSPTDPPGGGADPEGISFDARGNAYVGVFSVGEAGLRVLDPTGAHVRTVARGPADFVDLAADQCTLYWQDVNSETTYRTDACTAGSPVELAFPLATWASGSEPGGMRILADGSILSNERDVVVRVLPDGAGGTVVGTYDPPRPGCRWGYGLALGVGGETFWASCDETPYEIDVETGAVVRSLPSVRGVVGAVYGGFRAALDRTPPTVSLATPAEGAVYTVGAAVSAAYSCSDAGGSGLAACVGTAPAGAPIDTSSPGVRTFAVGAVDGAGNAVAATVTYTVAPQPAAHAPRASLYR